MTALWVVIGGVYSTFAKGTNIKQKLELCMPECMLDVGGRTAYSAAISWMSEASDQ